MFFPVVMYEYESRTIKKAENRRIDTFELWCWRRLFRVPWTARRSNQSILKEIQPVLNTHWKDDAEAEIPNLWPHDSKNWLFGKDPDAGKDWRWEEKRMTEDEINSVHLTRWTQVWASSGSWWWIGKPGMLQSMGSQRVGHDWVTELNWTNPTARNFTSHQCISYDCKAKDWVESKWTRDKD